LILKRAEGAGDAAAGGLDTIGLRVPSHAMARALLGAFGGGVAAPSANRFGRISPTTAAHVLEEFKVGVAPVEAAEGLPAGAVTLDARPAIDAVIDGGPTDVGLESTIVDLTRGAPVILRPGRISPEAIARALEEAGIVFDAGGVAGSAPAAPGTLDSHYAPRAAMRLMPRRDFTDVLSRQRGQRIAVLALEVSVPRVPVAVTRILPASSMLYARGLYAALRELDALGADLILVETPPTGPLWAAVNDRLRRAAHDHAIGSRADRHTQAWKGRKPGAGKAGETGADPEESGFNESGPDGMPADDAVDSRSD
jgi:L-threonylcarbamoyladenylate synthase